MILAVAGLAAVLLAGLVRLGTDALVTARARTAADAAALAATVAGADGAVTVAGHNGATVSAAEVAVTGGRVSATVSVASSDGDELTQQATSSAQRLVPVGGTGTRAGLAPAMLAALARADELLGTPVPIVSGHRSRARQQALWDARATNPYPVARPGTSLHELGLAVDVPVSFVPELLSVAASAGLCHPLPQSDPVHFVVCPITR